MSRRRQRQPHDDAQDSDNSGAKPVRGFWDVLGAAFGFFSQVLDALRGDRRLVVFWGICALLLVLLVVLLFLAPELPATLQFAAFTMIVVSIGALFLRSVPAPRRAAEAATQPTRRARRRRVSDVLLVVALAGLLVVILVLTALLILPAPPSPPAGAS